MGRIAVTGQGVLLQRLSGASEWIAAPAWTEREGIRGFAGQPLVFRGEVLGVLAVFHRPPTTLASRMKALGIPKPR